MYAGTTADMFFEEVYQKQQLADAMDLFYDECAMIAKAKMEIEKEKDANKRANLEAAMSMPQDYIEQECLNKWATVDPGVDRFQLSKTNGPRWKKVVYRTTIDADSGEILEDKVAV